MLSRRNLQSLKEIAGLAARVGTRGWNVRFPILTGRAVGNEDLALADFKQVFETLYHISLSAPLEVTTSDANHYRRYVAQRRGEGPELAGPNNATWRAAQPSDGRGSIFISHEGEIYPSGSLPISAGNVRFDSLAHVYRTPDSLRGKCGHCEYCGFCGGSRARAYAFHSDYLAAEPRCGFPPGKKPVSNLQGDAT
jgi:radical SAM protein with 4Fe4S-binding SPASM domain